MAARYCLYHCCITALITASLNQPHHTFSIRYMMVSFPSSNKYEMAALHKYSVEMNKAVIYAAASE
ncbi:MAG TPA: hypothetical protein VGW12_16730 [Pyrinomonadaceae bacterium]|nr:hypothetical protein [Pyrinomonadaceae bacterium]